MGAMECKGQAQTWCYANGVRFCEHLPWRWPGPVRKRRASPPVKVAGGVIKTRPGSFVSEDPDRTRPFCGDRTEEDRDKTRLDVTQETPCRR